RPCGPGRPRHARRPCSRSRTSPSRLPLSGPGRPVSAQARPIVYAAAPMSIRVVIADDQALLRTGFGLILNEEDDIEVVGEAENGLEAVDVVTRLRPDVVLMDVRMPGIDGLEATRRITSTVESEPPVRILVLTTFDLNEYVYAALRAGASGFLLKDVPPEQLVAGVRLVAE